MCPKLTGILPWNGPTVHVCCFILVRASTKTFVSRVQKTAKKISVSRKIRLQGHSLAEVSLYSGKPVDKFQLSLKYEKNDGYFT